VEPETICAKGISSKETFWVNIENVDISAGILIWLGGVRTKKRKSVEDELRKALQVPSAIGMPTTKGGTKITEVKNSPTPKGDGPTITRARTRGEELEDGDGTSGIETDSLVDDRPDVRRRSTVAFGTSGEKELEFREKGASIAAPERKLASAGRQGLSSPIEKASEIKEREIR
jgi:hypothetical protein